MDNRKFYKKIKKQSVWKKRKNYDHIATFGTSPIPLPTKLLFLSNLLDQGNTEKCTAFTSAAVRAPMKGKEYDPEFHWQQELKLLGVADANGVDLETPMKVGVGVGFLPIGGTVPQDKAKAYFFVNKLFGMDLFDAIRHTINDIKAPLSVGLMWYREWDNTLQGIIPHTQLNLLGGHDTKIAGFTSESIPEIGFLNPTGTEYLVIQGSWGKNFGLNGFFFFDRYMVNLCFTLGVLYWTDSDIPDPQRTGLIRAIILELISLYQQLLTRKQLASLAIVPDQSITPPATPIQ